MISSFKCIETQKGGVIKFGKILAAVALLAVGGCTTAEWDSYVVPPVVVAKDWSGGAIFPLAFADFKGDDTSWSVFPVAYSHSWDYDNSTFWSVAGVYGRKIRGGEVESQWLAPFWWRHPKDRFAAFACGLVGWDHGDDDDRLDWIMPYWKRSTPTRVEFGVWPFYSRSEERGADDEVYGKSSFLGSLWSSAWQTEDDEVVATESSIFWGLFRRERNPARDATTYFLGHEIW